jgi:hypothetical protein
MLVRVIAFVVFFVAAPVASPAQSLDCCRHSAPTTTTRTRMASVMPSLLAKSSRLRRSWRGMGLSSRGVPMTR